MMNRMRIKDCITEIFSYINYDFGAGMNALLDTAYLAHSGNKRISPLVEDKLDSVTLGKHINIFGVAEYYYTGTITAANLTIIGNIIKSMYKDPWDRLHDAITSEYNPINNYDMHETLTESEAHTGTVVDDGDSTHSVKASQTDNEVYGFNSDDPVGSDRQTGTSSEEGTDDNTRSEDRARGLLRTTERSGNIGVTTSAQMITGEIELRANWNFYEQVFNDIDKVLACVAY